MPHERKIRRLIAALGLLIVVVMGGAYRASLHLWPFSPPEKRVTHDALGRLTDFPGKAALPCPVQSAGTMVLLLIGQSNTGNHAEQRHASAYGDRVLNYFAGKCFVAASPLLGTSGEAGESWTLLGNQLVAAGLADRVVLIPAGLGGTSIRRWQQGGDLNGMLLSVLDEARPRYRITHVLWHQGESDFVDKTTQKDYATMFASLVDSLRNKGVAAPVFASVTTMCPLSSGWFPGNPTALAQQALPDRARRIFAGLNTDVLLGPADRNSGCHFTRTGQEKFAQAWFDILRRSQHAGIAD
jgi:hypothetical protein